MIHGSLSLKHWGNDSIAVKYPGNFDQVEITRQIGRTCCDVDQCFYHLRRVKGLASQTLREPLLLPIVPPEAHIIQIIQNNKPRQSAFGQ
jgi:hypothetical protein